MVRGVESLSYVSISSRWGGLSVVWRKTEGAPRVYRVLLPKENELALVQGVTQVALSDAGSLLPPEIAEFGERMERFLAGEGVEFEQRHINLLALETCSGFQRRVLLAEYGIPQGWVSTYGRIATHLGVPGGARAVGSALGSNPFPIVIPCHRAVRADGALGGFRGGVEMKRALLTMEGVEISQEGKVLTDRFYY
jgi:methylated-DNA-[protein]-cysteine S-methyltransferase